MNSVDLTSRAWKHMQHEQKEELLRTLGYDKSFAKASTMEELVGRGGGMVARDFHKTVNKWMEINPSRKVKFR